ncbi:MAG: alpha/beta hydrolase [Roseobacter sp.]
MKINAPTTDATNLLYGPEELDQAHTIAILVPGALTRISMFDAIESWRARGYGLVHYRFPGLDGRPVSPALSINEAAAEIVELVARHPDKPVRLLGFSTGGPIVLSAGAQISGDVRVAAMACAVELGGGVQTAMRCAYDIMRAAARARSLRLRSVWPEYYQVLLFGRAVWDSDELRARARTIIEARRDKIVLPQGGKPRAHTRDLRRWRLPENLQLAVGQVKFFWGAEDPVFSYRQQSEFSEKVGCAPVKAYPKQGHLLFASHPEVFEDIYAFFEGIPEKTTGAGHSE